ncbi:uncharacterized protein LOC121980719 [Zingiber officinale]|uniref:uncharacterized protein LOC121980719 n=1 Tax=Zingiber officinale TaxID=94328 RepID=UPI001C4CEE6E|nr:uncharacterized protein LOC121980719 [Zingiber officinale]XP_042388826.1 uncharacterized protein LOC121980719 [Zingiber officinale]XP_042388827.1 uncharacterized protein LOC121980719 [Zingiber officinale]
MATPTCLIQAPCSLVQILFLLGLRMVALAMLLWWQVLMIGVTFLTLPIRMLAALYNEIKLHGFLIEMQREMQHLLEENKNLEECLKIASEDQRVMNSTVKEIEEEHWKDLRRINLLENEMQKLYEQKSRLKEVKGKNLRDDRASYGKDVRRVTTLSDPDHGKDEQVVGEKGEALRQRRTVALLQSLFSTILSLLVSVIIWVAEDACVPLVIALFTVVVISLASVREFLSTIRNKPASDAVALLSINCFMLGALSAPILPIVARMVTPSLIRFADRLF